MFRQLSGCSDDVNTLLETSTSKSDISSIVEESVSLDEEDYKENKVNKREKSEEDIPFVFFSLGSLSNESFVNILLFLDLRDFYPILLTSRRFFDLASDSSLWKKLFLRNIGSLNFDESDEIWKKKYLTHLGKRREIMISHMKKPKKWELIMDEFQKLGYIFQRDCILFFDRDDIRTFKNMKKKGNDIFQIIFDSCLYYKLDNLLDLSELISLCDNNEDEYMNYVLRNKNSVHFFINDIDKWIHCYKSLEKIGWQDRFLLTLFDQPFFFRVVGHKEFFFLFNEIAHDRKPFFEFLSTSRVYHHVLSSVEDLKNISSKTSNQYEKLRLLQFSVIFEKSRRNLTKTLDGLEEYIELFGNKKRKKKVCLDLFLDFSFLSRYPLKDVLSCKILTSLVKKEFLEYITSRKKIFKKLSLHHTAELLLLLKSYPNDMERILTFYYKMRLTKRISDFEKISFQFPKYDYIFLNHLVVEENELERLIKCRYDITFLLEKFSGNRILRKKLKSFYEIEEGICIIL